MAKTEFTPAELKAYFTDKRKHYYCDDARKKEKDMRVHADGCFPELLINERRPNESMEVLTYRKKIFVPTTKPYFNKIENTLQKIRRSSDWSIKYPDESFDRIIEGEKMTDYAEHNFPMFDSITNWAFSLLLRNYLIDANALVMVAPIEIPTVENEFLRPIVSIFNSCEVLDYVPDDYAVMENKIGCTYRTQNSVIKGKSFWVVTTQTIYRWDQSDGRGNYIIAYEYDHGLGILPVFKMGGIVVDVYGLETLYDSRICGVLPGFNEALREYSDLQAAVVLSMFPERWEYTQNDCVKCKGTGRRMDNQVTPPCQVSCETCNGTGYIATGPYSKTLIKPAAADQKDLPTPPIGYVAGPTDIIKLQQESVKHHIYSALASINFEFLTDTPLNQSGTAKEVDKDELNSMVHSIAEDIVRIIDKVYWLIALYRYGNVYSADEIYAMLPKIAVPEKYDILGTKYYDEQMTSAIKNKLNPAIINAMEVTYATKMFNNDTDIARHVALVLSLDPLAGISEDDKNSRLSNNGITLLDYVVSSNINKFVAAALESDTGFADKDIIEQKKTIYAMAAAQMTAEVNTLIPTDTPTDG